MSELLGIALRISVMYIYVLALLRLSGKRSVGNLTPFDFVIATLIGDMFDDIFWAEIPLSQAVVGITTVILLHTLVSYGAYRSIPFDQLVGSGKTTVIKQGSFLEDGLRSERTRKEEVVAEVRLLGEDQLEEIKEANWEPSGKVSVLKREEAKPVQKRDLPRLKEVFE